MINNENTDVSIAYSTVCRNNSNIILSIESSSIGRGNKLNLKQSGEKRKSYKDIATRIFPFRSGCIRKGRKNFHLSISERGSFEISKKRRRSIWWCRTHRYTGARKWFPHIFRGYIKLSRILHDISIARSVRVISPREEA